MAGDELDDAGTFEVTDPGYADFSLSSDDAMIGESLDGIITSWNSAAERMFGFTAAEIIGRSVSALAAPGYETDSGAILGKLRGGRSVERHETVRRHKDGRLLFVILTVRPVRNAAGETVGVLKFVRDVTAQHDALQALQEREARLRAIFESIPDGMILIDNRGIVQSFSPVAERIFGWTAAEVCGRNVSMLMPTPDREAHDGYLERYQRTGEARIIGIGRLVHGRRKDGSVFPMELAIGEVRTDGAPSFTGFVRDVSERQATEARLRETEAELAHLSRLGAMGQMAAMLAHEINQPLTAVTNYMKAGKRLLEQDGPIAIDRLREAMEKSADQALRAGQIIRRLRDFTARGETEKRIEPIGAIVEEARSLALAGARHSGARVVFAGNGWEALVLVDRIQIEQVLLNLVRNALEAMDREPHPQVAIEVADSGGQVRVTVTDRGAGLAPEVADQLFQPFVTTKRTGMGIGLSICRSIVEAHGGRLWYEANPAGGAIFRFTLTAVQREENR